MGFFVSGGHLYLYRVYSSEHFFSQSWFFIFIEPQVYRMHMDECVEMMCVPELRNTV